MTVEYARNAQPRAIRDPSGRPPPHDLEAEADLISNVIFKPDSFDAVALITKAEHFFDEKNQVIWAAIVAVADEGATVEESTVRNYLRDREQLATVGGARGLNRLVLERANVHDLERVANRIRDFYRLRELTNACWTIAAEAYGDCGEVQPFIEAAETTIANIGAVHQARSAITLGGSIKTVFEAIGQDKPAHCLKTGIVALDERIVGLFAGKLYVVGARPGMGKSALAMQIATNVAGGKSFDEDGKELESAVLFVSLEMDHPSLSLRAVCSLARVPQDDVLENRVTQMGWRELSSAASWLSKARVTIVDTAEITPLEIRSQCRQLAATLRREGKARLALVAVDYIQMVNGKPLVSRNASREQEVAVCSRSMKRLAKEMRVPVIALSQINRASEKTREKRPSLADLRESGGIEADADQVWLLHREEYYLKNSTPQEKRGLCEIDIAKNRGGWAGVVPTHFHGKHTLFSKWEGPWESYS